MAARYSSASVRVDGLADLQKALKNAPPQWKRAFNREMQPVAAEVAAAVRAKVPSRSGAARASVKPSTAGGALAVRAGGSSVPYYPWLDFGGTLHASGGRRNTQKRPFFKEGRWIYPTIARMRPEIYSRALEIVERWKRVTF